MKHRTQSSILDHCHCISSPLHTYPLPEACESLRWRRLFRVPIRSLYVSERSLALSVKAVSALLMAESACDSLARSEAEVLDIFRWIFFAMLRRLLGSLLPFSRMSNELAL